MISPKLFVPYTAISAATMGVAFACAFGFITVDLLVGLVGSILAVFQIVLALHAHWLQSISNEELNAIGEVFNTNGGKNVIKQLLGHPHIPAAAIVSSCNVPMPTAFNAIQALEEKGIVLSKLSFSLGTYQRVYSLNPTFKRIVRKFRFAL